jgi:putative hemolysin
MQTEFSRPALSVSALLSEPLRSMLYPVEPAIQKLLAFDELWQVFQTARAQGGPATVHKLLSLLGISYHIDAAELKEVPRCGPVVALANHPFGLLEGAILADALPKIRPDVKILANALLASIPELHAHCIFIDPFGRPDSVSANASALRECIRWLRRGGLLAGFPAGEVAHINWKDGSFGDPPWNQPLARLAQLTGACCVPVFFKGANSLAFQVAGAIHPSLRTASLPRELLNKRGRRIELRIGRPVSHATLQSFAGAKQATDYLRCRTYLLDTAEKAGSDSIRSFPARLLPFKKPEPIAAPPPQPQVAAEIAALPPGRKLCETGNLAAFLGSSAELPTVLQEIGRLREIAFRQAGEGTGRSIDLDQFDRYYQHLVLWNQSAGEVAGAYRLGATPDILPRYGIGGLYTSTLFRYRRELFERIGPAVELGRSFIRPEYQKQYAPLLLLWKGIGRYVASRPECATLFGGVSISNSYHALSRHLLVKFMEGRRADDLACEISPRRPYRPDERLFRRTGQVSQVPADVETLSTLIADIEKDGKGVPILIKQYLKTGGRLLAFNVDRGFSDALDALIMVDLRKAPGTLLERYLGKPGAIAFRAWHGSEK